MSIPAQYPGYCSECGGVIHMGDLIVSVDDQWQHEACESVEKKDPPLCTECFILHVGECA